MNDGPFDRTNDCAWGAVASSSNSSGPAPPQGACIHIQSPRGPPCPVPSSRSVTGGGFTCLPTGVSRDPGWWFRSHSRACVLDLAPWLGSFSFGTVHDSVFKCGRCQKSYVIKVTQPKIYGFCSYTDTYGLYESPYDL
jgi:hypothetical protein